MSAQSAAGREADETAELGDSPGRRLRLARQARGMEIAQVAAELHLSPSKIEALEQDDYDALSGEVFVVGYIRKYARVLGLDPAPLLEIHDAAAPRRASLRPRRIARRLPSTDGELRSSHWMVRLITIAILILPAVLAFDWWQSRLPVGGPEAVDLGAGGETIEPAVSEPGPEPQAAAPVAGDVTQVPVAPPPTEAEPSAQAPAPAAPDQRPPSAPPGDDASAEVPATVDGTPAQPASATVPEAGEEEPATDTVEIVMTFDGPCWVDVRDSERKYKLFGEMKKGDRHVLEGTPPYSVILGNAAAAEITVGGEKFDLSAISQGNVARFTLDPSQRP